jgi:Cupin
MERSVPEPTPRPKMGQRSFTWNEPGEWSYDPVKKLSHSTVRLNIDGNGAGTTIVIAKYEPGAVVGPHYHHADYCSLVVEGSIEITRREHTVGSMRVVNAGTTYGPLVAGPEGCTMVDVFATGVADPSLSAMNTYL